MRQADIMSGLAWAGLSRELARWRARGHKPRLWWRDDDAGEAVPALERLLALSVGRGLPITLAVIPHKMTPALPALVVRQGVTVAQHGTDHRDRSGGGPSTEFPPSEPPASIATRLAEGWARLEPLPNRIPLFVPPWNALSDSLIAGLPLAGFRGLSATGQPWPLREPLPRLDVMIDLLRWKPAPAFRGTRAILRRLKRALRERRRTGRWDAPIGLLTHHLDHDEATWAFIESLPARLGTKVSWLGHEDLITFLAEPAGSLQPGEPAS